jgi:hypothetical protein
VAGGGKHRPRRAFLWNTYRGGTPAEAEIRRLGLLTNVANNKQMIVADISYSQFLST